MYPCAVSTPVIANQESTSCRYGSSIVCMFASFFVAPIQKLRYYTPKNYDLSLSRTIECLRERKKSYNNPSTEHNNGLFAERGD